MGQWCSAHQVENWAYCLMPNHVHLIAVPQPADGLRRANGDVHRRCTRMVKCPRTRNFRKMEKCREPSHTARQYSIEETK